MKHESYKYVVILR